MTIQEIIDTLEDLREETRKRKKIKHTSHTKEEYDKTIDLAVNVLKMYLTKSLEK